MHPVFVITPPDWPAHCKYLISFVLSAFRSTNELESRAHFRKMKERYNICARDLNFY